MYTHTYIYIYIYIYIHILLSGGSNPPRHWRLPGRLDPQDLRVRGSYGTKILDFRGFDSSIISISRGGILLSIGDLPESFGQAILVGIIFVGRSGLVKSTAGIPSAACFCFRFCSKAFMYCLM